MTFSTKDFRENTENKISKRSERIGFKKQKFSSQQRRFYINIEVFLISSHFISFNFMSASIGVRLLISKSFNISRIFFITGSSTSKKLS